MLKPIVFSATAAGNSERGTMSPTEACHAGRLNALPQPIRNVNINSSQGVIQPNQVNKDSSTDITITM